MVARASGTEQVVRSRLPATRSCIAGAAPFDADHETWFAGNRIACIQPTSARCQMPPCPVPDALNFPGGATLMALLSSCTVLYGEDVETWMPGGSSFISASAVKFLGVKCVNACQCIIEISTVSMPIV